jgi:hypothetical protein
LQAYEGVCRDYFEIIPNYVESEEFKSLLKETNGIYTENFSSCIFDNCFTRSYNIEFVFNANIKEFGKKFKYGDKAEIKKSLTFTTLETKRKPPDSFLQKNFLKSSLSL